jgi:carboxylesterase type B
VLELYSHVSRIRYAAPPVGQNRWRPPQPPAENAASIILANTAPPRCPQASNAPFSQYDWRGDEDCLFLNVYVPKDAKDLPVLVWIHGGGYGAGDSNQLPGSIIARSKGKIVGVAIQYRLGAFGFLASEDVKKDGTLNAGLLDQRFALKWVQKYIHLFGGSASQITVGGQSAGAGSALLQALIRDNESQALFSNVIAASPYLPYMYTYKDTVPTGWYQTFAGHAGCGGFPDDTGANVSLKLDCLRTVSSADLQFSNAKTSASGPYGSWAFQPVLDDTFLQITPGRQLKDGIVGGYRVLSSNVANEGPEFVPQNISSEGDLTSWLRLTYRSFSTDEISKILAYYSTAPTAILSANTNRYATNGISGATALTTSSFAAGYQQMAHNIYAEATIICPSYWFVDAFSSNSSTPEPDIKAGYKYQFSAGASRHGADLAALYGGTEEQGMGPDLSGAFQLSWANFIVHNNPSIPIKYANGRALGMGDTGAEKLAKWPGWEAGAGGARPMVNWNQTGGEQYEVQVLQAAQKVVQFRGKGLRNSLDVYDAWDWEGGRGERCEFWRGRT